MAKRRVKKEVPLTRKQVSRRQKERRQRLIMIGVAAFVAAMIVIILAYGVYTELLAKPSRPVAVVNDVPISMSTYEKRVRLQRMSIDTYVQGLQVQRSKFDPDTEQFAIEYIDKQLSDRLAEREGLATEAFLDALIEEELIRQAAAEAGVPASDEEIDRRIEESLGYYRDEAIDVASPTGESITTTSEVSPTLTPTGMTRSEFDEIYDSYLSAVQETAGISEEELRDTVEAQILRQKMEELITQDVPTSELQIRARHILLESKAEAEVVLKRLQDGEDFGALAEEVSKDPGSAQQGGDLGWFAKGSMVPEFEEVAFDLDPGMLSDVVATQYGFHIITVDERDEDRELDPAMLYQRKGEAFNAWLLELRDSATIESYWSVDKVPPE